MDAYLPSSAPVEVSPPGPEYWDFFRSLLSPGPTPNWATYPAILNKTAETAPHISALVGDYSMTELTEESTAPARSPDAGHQLTYTLRELNEGSTPFLGHHGKRPNPIGFGVALPPRPSAGHIYPAEYATEHDDPACEPQSFFSMYFDLFGVFPPPILMCPEAEEEDVLPTSYSSLLFDPGMESLSPSTSDSSSAADYSPFLDLFGKGSPSIIPTASSPHSSAPPIAMSHSPSCRNSYSQKNDVPHFDVTYVDDSESGSHNINWDWRLLADFYKPVPSPVVDSERLRERQVLEDWKSHVVADLLQTAADTSGWSPFAIALHATTVYDRLFAAYQTHPPPPDVPPALMDLILPQVAQAQAVYPYWQWDNILEGLERESQWVRSEM
ncbi:hypothetical protein B0H17DRAFT_1328608 [Mycena rosella]|uniref:Uncharacterized protein n=1 Tax=Mycena rosella TaxID=1033263 RepID=A0AAD7DTY0_MYCRO|nr:hypothetical protein B0H17DRAFT_1328608 [Mycena rosella]